MDISTKERLHRLADERAELVREMARTAIPPLTRGNDGVFQISADSVGQNLYRRCYDDGWVDRSFDWVTWAQSAECKDLSTDRTKLRSASPDQLTHLLTMLIRQDRLCYGAWAETLKSGLLLAILERALTLATDTFLGSPGLLDCRDAV
jgi:hypothetical protein